MIVLIVRVGLFMIGVILWMKGVEMSERRPMVGEMITFRTFMGSRYTCEVTDLFVEDGVGGFYGKVPSTRDHVWGFDDQIVEYIRVEHVPMGNWKGERI